MIFKSATFCIYTLMLVFKSLHAYSMKISFWLTPNITNAYIYCEDIPQASFIKNEIKVIDCQLRTSIITQGKTNVMFIDILGYVNRWRCVAGPILTLDMRLFIWGLWPMCDYNRLCCINVQTEWQKFTKCARNYKVQLKSSWILSILYVNILLLFSLLNVSEILSQYLPNMGKHDLNNTVNTA